jgi:hypothetical protein
MPKKRGKYHQKQPASSRNGYTLASFPHFNFVVRTRSSKPYRKTKTTVKKTENRLLFLLLFCFLCFKSNSRRMQKSRNSTKEREKHMFKKILLLPEMDLHLLRFFTSSSMSARDRQIYSRKPKSSAQNRTQSTLLF